VRGEDRPFSEWHFLATRTRRRQPPLDYRGGNSAILELAAHLGSLDGSMPRLASGLTAGADPAIALAPTDDPEEHAFMPFEDASYGATPTK
jgi:hypothetical protein